MINLCAPAIIYFIFSVTQIFIDIYRGDYNTAVTKVIVTLMVTLLLNILCDRGLTTISWIIVFIPFILMTFIVTVLLYVFGLDAATGELNYDCQENESSSINNVSTDSQGNIIIYDPEYDPSINPVYFNSPNIIIPNPEANDNTNTNFSNVPYGSSSPEYQS
jgi:hypothetical protein